MNPLLFLGIAVLIVCAAAMLICHLADDTYTVDDEPEREPLAADFMCMVAGCPREWQTDRTGWRLCHTHYRELVTDREAS